MVLPLYNALVTLEAYLGASTAITLPPQVANVPQYQSLTKAFTDWQEDLWEQFFVSLLNSQILAQAQEINNFYKTDETAPVPDQILQQECQRAVFEPGQPISIVQRSAVQFANLVAQGADFAQQLDQVIAVFTDIDIAKVKAALTQVQTLNDDFQSQEQAINQDMLNADATLLTTTVNVLVDVGLMAVGDEATDPIKPLKEGIVQIGKDVGKAIYVSTQVGDTLTALEAAITALDEAEYQLFQILIARQQLEGLTSQTQPALKALSRIEIEWGRVADTIAASLTDWSNDGMTQIGEWASLMTLLAFQAPTSQMLSYDGSTWSASPG